jgi:hypothetical protein
MEFDALYWVILGLAAGYLGRAAVPGGRCISAPIAMTVTVGGAVVGGLIYALAMGYPTSHLPTGPGRWLPETALALGGAMVMLLGYALASGRVEVVHHDTAHPFQPPVW